MQNEEICDGYNMKDPIVTFFPSITSGHTIHKKMSEVISDFSSNKYKEKILYLRNTLIINGEELYRKKKSLLPAVAFCGEFSGGHARNNIVRHNNLLVFDIDHLKEEEMVPLKQKMMGCNYITSLWTSPSGNGYKGIIQLDYQNVPMELELELKYRHAFRVIYEYFLKELQIELDKNCKDFTRLCYVCWDEDLYFNKNAEQFVIDCSEINSLKSSRKTDKIKDVAVSSTDKHFKYENVKGKNSNRSREIVASIIRYLSKRNLSITNSYDDWIIVGFAIANTFNYDLGLKYFLEFSKMDKGKYNEFESIKKLQNCYNTGRGDVGIGTIIDMAQKKGYKIKGSS